MFRFVETLLRDAKWWFFPKPNPRQNLGMLGDLDDVEIVRHVELYLGISVSDAEAEAVQNVGQFYDLCRDKCTARGRSLSWAEFTKLIEEFSAIPACEMRPETEFFETEY